MLQFYFLSILFNLVTGLILVNRIDESSEKGLVLAGEGNADASTVSDSQAKKKSKSEQKNEESQEQAENHTENAVSLKHSKAKKLQNEFRKTSLFESKTFRLVLGILTGLTGILKFISVIKTDVPVVGDLLPALIGIAGSFCLLLEYYINAATIEVTLPEAVKRIFVKNSNIIGFLSIVIAVIHFIFPTVLFL